jgi:hypothetical protein
MHMGMSLAGDPGFLKRQLQLLLQRLLLRCHPVRGGILSVRVPVRMGM